MPDDHLLSRELQVYGGVELALHRTLLSEINVPALEGVGVSLHLSAPNPLRLRWDGGGTRDIVERPGEMWIIPPGAPFEQVGATVSDDLHLFLDGGLVSRVAEEAGVAAPERIEFLARTELRDERMERIMRSFLPELESEGLGGELYAQSLASALAVYLLRKHSSLGERTKRKIYREPQSGLSERALRQTLDYVNDNLSAKLSLDEMAYQANLSTHHFARMFKRSVGLSPHQYVIRRRVEMAKGLLLRGVPIGETARLAGFSDQGHLARHTKRSLGVSPSGILEESKNVRKGDKILRD